MNRWDRIEGYVTYYGPMVCVLVAFVCFLVMLGVWAGQVL